MPDTGNGRLTHVGNNATHRQARERDQSADANAERFHALPLFKSWQDDALVLFDGLFEGLDFAPHLRVYLPTDGYAHQPFSS